MVGGVWCSRTRARVAIAYVQLSIFNIRLLFNYLIRYPKLSSEASVPFLRDMDLDYAVFSIISPMIFLMLAKHSADACVSDQASMDPEKFIASQLQIILYGMSQAPLQNKSLQKETKE